MSPLRPSILSHSPYASISPEYQKTGEKRLQRAIPPMHCAVNQSIYKGPTQGIVHNRAIRIAESRLLLELSPVRPRGNNDD